MRIVLAAQSLGLCVAVAAAQDLVLWDGSAPADVSVVGVGPQGVRVVEQGADVGTLIAWDRVREVRGRHADAADVYGDVALAAWLARTRLDRGDRLGARRAIADVAPRYAGEVGPTSEVLAAILLMVALERGEHADAVSAWASWRAATAPGTLRHRPTPPVVDAQAELAPELFPLWAQAEVRVPDFGGTAGELYELAAQAQADGPGDRVTVRADAIWARTTTERDTLANDLLLVCVAATSGGAQTRGEARALLRGMLGSDRGQPTIGWRRAWALLAVGRSLVLEQDAKARRAGVLRLLEVAAEYGDEFPLLGGHALGEAARALASDGRDIESAKVRLELSRRYPGHPADQATRGAEQKRIGRRG